MLDELERDPLALTEEEKFTLLAVLAVLMILVLYFEFRIMRGNAKSVRKINARKDETYNAILTCNSVINSLESIADEIVSEPRTMSREDSYRGAKLEVQGGPNYLVAKFEINTAKEEIAAATASGQDASEASATLRKAQTEFDSGN